MNKSALIERLADLQSWRYGLNDQINHVENLFQQPLFTSSGNNGELQKELQRLRQRISAERLTIAFIAQPARGKSSLIDALFFCGTHPQLPYSIPRDRTRCVTEIRFDRESPASIKLLPIETRESPLRFEELVQDQNLWKTQFFDITQPASVVHALATLAETKSIPFSEIVAWGLHRESPTHSPGGHGPQQFQVPCWRYAVVNFPHPLLEAGLVIFDVPGHSPLAVEPELARARVLTADVMALVLDINDVANATDLAIWKNYFGPMQGREKSDTEKVNLARLVILNKIDTLGLDQNAERESPAQIALQTIDKRLLEVVDWLHIDPIQAIPVSAKLGLAGKLSGNLDQTIKSRLYQLERNLAANLSDTRQQWLSTQVIAALSAMLDQLQAWLDAERYSILGQLKELGALREKNEKLLTALQIQMTTKQNKLDGAEQEVRRFKGIQTHITDELAELTNPLPARKQAAHICRTLASNSKPAAIPSIVESYFSEAHKRLDATNIKIKEVKSLFGDIAQKLQNEFGMRDLALLPFATQRFYTELQKLRTLSNTELTNSEKNGGSTALQGQALGEEFHKSIGGAVIHIFEIAHRELAVWIQGFYAAVDRSFEGQQNQLLRHAENIENMKNAEMELADNIAAVQAHFDILKYKHAALDNARETLARFSDKWQES